MGRSLKVEDLPFSKSKTLEISPAILEFIFTNQRRNDIESVASHSLVSAAHH